MSGSNSDFSRAFFQPGSTEDEGPASFSLYLRPSPRAPHEQVQARETDISTSNPTAQSASVPRLSDAAVPATSNSTSHETRDDSVPNPGRGPVSLKLGSRLLPGMQLTDLVQHVPYEEIGRGVAHTQPLLSAGQALGLRDFHPQATRAPLIEPLESAVNSTNAEDNTDPATEGLLLTRPFPDRPNRKADIHRTQDRRPTVIDLTVNSDLASESPAPEVTGPVTTPLQHQPNTAHPFDWQLARTDNPDRTVSYDGVAGTFPASWDFEAVHRAGRQRLASVFRSNAFLSRRRQSALEHPTTAAGADANQDQATDAPLFDVDADLNQAAGTTPLRKLIESSSYEGEFVVQPNRGLMEFVERKEHAGGLSSDIVFDTFRTSIRSPFVSHRVSPPEGLHPNNRATTRPVIVPNPFRENRPDSNAELSGGVLVSPGIQANDNTQAQPPSQDLFAQPLQAAGTRTPAATTLSHPAREATNPADLTESLDDLFSTLIDGSQVAPPILQNATDAQVPDVGADVDENERIVAEMDQGDVNAQSAEADEDIMWIEEDGE